MTNSYFNVVNDDFQKQLEANLTTYTTFSTDLESDANLFSTRKEIAIARYALSSQAIAYQGAMEILLEHLSFVRTQQIHDPKLFTSVMTLLAGIEQKSKALIDSAREVTRLLGEAVAIDVDKAAFKTLLLNVPILLEQTITTISGDTELAQKISLSFNNRINDMMIQMRLNKSDLPDSSGGGVSMNEMQLLMNSVPTQPYSSPQNPEPTTFDQSLSQQSTQQTS